MYSSTIIIPVAPGPPGCAEFKAKIEAPEPPPPYNTPENPVPDPAIDNGARKEEPPRF